MSDSTPEVISESPGGRRPRPPVRAIEGRTIAVATRPHDEKARFSGERSHRRPQPREGEQQVRPPEKIRSANRSTGGR